MIQKQKKQPVKRKYTKKGSLIPAAPKDKAKDNEVDLLMGIILIFENWDSEQRSRALKYLASRYYDFM